MLFTSRVYNHTLALAAGNYQWRRKQFICEEAHFLAQSTIKNWVGPPLYT